VRPDFVINAAGLVRAIPPASPFPAPGATLPRLPPRAQTGRPNVDWCEDHKTDVVRVNVVGTLSLLDAVSSRGVHCTNLATGCIFSYDDAHPLGSGRGFTEDDAPNFAGSWYSETKGAVERLSRVFPHVLTLRLRMPISDDLHPRSFVTKITRYERVVDIPNSMTVLHDLLPAVPALAEARVTGVLNFTNPGTASHNQVLALYRDLVDPAFRWSNFSEAEQALVLKARRSNNELDASRLLAVLARVAPGLVVPPLLESLVGVFMRMRAAKDADAAHA
jgi:nucleoside-diphosphate-sugar epimerase